MGNSIIFGIALLNEETYESFSWVWKAFGKVHEGKMPKVIITDEDIALKKSIEDIKESKHLLCQWHIGRNLRRKALKLKELEEDDLHERITQLIYCKDKEFFDYEIKDILEKLKFLKLDSLADQILRLDKNREKVVVCFLPQIFYGGSCTT